MPHGEVVKVMSDWRAWRVPEWNERLLEYFFGRRDDGGLPVVVLLVTPEELARATGDRGADAAEVREAFLAAVRNAIRRGGSFLGDASNYQAWPRPPGDDIAPRFISHLIFTCIAASESSDDLASEGSFLERLRTLTEDQLPDHTLQWLPRLWENLAEWLAAGGNAGRYRGLKLPDPGVFSRIGYTVKLAFPDRRDQRQLSELLGGAGLAGQEPPVGKVISLVASARARFRPSFLEAFDEFRRGVESRAQRGDRIVEHRFWAAVRDAALRGRGANDVPELRARIQILCEEEGDRLMPFLVADEAIADAPGVATVELPMAYGPWRFAVVPTGGTIEAGGLRKMIGELLERKLSLPRLSALAVQGVLPLVESTHGLLELAGQDELEDARVVLARKDLAEELVRVYGRGSPRVDPSNYEGWVEIHGLKLRRLPSQELDATSLRRCWMFHESLIGPKIRVHGGVRADDGWLGFREVLPVVAMPGAREVKFEDAAGNGYALFRDGEGNWRFPNGDLTGDFELIATIDDETVVRRSIRLHGTLGSESFRTPADPEAWIVEGVGGTSTLAAESPFTKVACDREAPIAERTTYLGPIVGEFVDGPERAAWRVTSFAGKKLGARCSPDLAGTSACARATSASNRRRWRQLLLNSAADPADPGFETARRAIRKQVLADLPKVDVPALTFEVESRSGVQAVRAVDRLLTIISSRAAGRTGLSWGDWNLLVQNLLGVGRERVEAISRGWAEAGVIDIGSYARWRHRCVFARSPIVAAFRIGGAVGGTVMGVMLPATRLAVRAAAQREGILVEERTGVSRFVPSTLTFRATAGDRLEALCRSTGMTLRWLDVGFEEYTASCRHDGLTPQPVNYEDHRRWQRWSLQAVSGVPALTFEHCIRSNRPDYWAVADGRVSVWSYDLNTARSWAAALIGEPAVVADGVAGLAAGHGYVPLPLARMLCVLGGRASGPDDGRDWQYRYMLPSQGLRARILDLLQRTFDPRRLASCERAKAG